MGDGTGVPFGTQLLEHPFWGYTVVALVVLIAAMAWDAITRRRGQR